MNIVIELDAKKELKKFVERTIIAFADDYDIDRHNLNELKSAAVELFLNACIHSGSKKVQLKMKVTNTKVENEVKTKLTLIFRDYGKGIENINKAKEPFYTTCNKEERAGLGFTIAEQFSDMFKIKNMKPGLECTIVKIF